MKIICAEKNVLTYFLLNIMFRITITLVRLLVCWNETDGNDDDDDDDGEDNDRSNDNDDNHHNNSNNNHNNNNTNHTPHPLKTQAPIQMPNKTPTN